jgi:subtilase family serine protease
MLAEIYQYCNSAFTYPINLPYTVFSQSGYNAFVSVTSGNNGYSLSIPTPTYYATGAYNDATGIGIPRGMPFAQSYCPNRTPVSSSRAAPLARRAVSAITAQAYSINVTPQVRGLVDEGRKAASDQVKFQVGIVPGEDVAANEAAVVAVLQSAGFSIVQTFSNHLLVDATGSSASVERLFATEIHNALQGQGSAVYLPMTSITVPASLAPYVSGVILDDVVTRFPITHVAPPVHFGLGSYSR